jgi:hypothetical protein
MQQRTAAIVGIHEYPSRKTDGKVSPMQIRLRAPRRRLRTPA